MLRGSEEDVGCRSGTLGAAASPCRLLVLAVADRYFCQFDLAVCRFAARLLPACDFLGGSTTMKCTVA